MKSRLSRQDYTIPKTLVCVQRFQMGFRHRLQSSTKQNRSVNGKYQSNPNKLPRLQRCESRSSRICKKLSEKHTNLHNRCKSLLVRKNYNNQKITPSNTKCFKTRDEVSSGLRNLDSQNNSSSAYGFTKRSSYTSRHDTYKLRSEDKSVGIDPKQRNVSLGTQFVQSQCLHLTTESLQSLQNSLNMAQQAESTGVRSLNMLQDQIRKLEKTEEKLHRLDSYNRIAKDNIHCLTSGNFPKVLDSNEMTARPKSWFHEKQLQKAYTRTPLNIKQNSKEYRCNVDYLQRDMNYSQILDHVSTNTNSDVEENVERALDGLSKVVGRLHWIAERTSEELDSQLNRLSTTENTLDCVNGRVSSNIRRMRDIS